MKQIQLGHFNWFMEIQIGAVHKGKNKTKNKQINKQKQKQQQNKNKPKTNKQSKTLKKQISFMKQFVSPQVCQWTILSGLYMNKNSSYFRLTIFLQFQNILEKAH